MDLKELSKISEPLHRIEDMAFVGTFVCNGTFRVDIWPTEGEDTPHVHVTSKNVKGKNGKDFDCCIELREAKYFKHGPHIDEFSKRKQAEAFNDFMHSLIRKLKRVQMTYYEYSCTTWVLRYPEEDLPKLDENGEVIIPDYSQL